MESGRAAAPWVASSASLSMRSLLTPTDTPCNGDTPWAEQSANPVQQRLEADSPETPAHAAASELAGTAGRSPAAITSAPSCPPAAVDKSGESKPDGDGTGALPVMALKGQLLATNSPITASPVSRNSEWSFRPQSRPAPCFTLNALHSGLQVLA